MSDTEKDNSGAAPWLTDENEQEEGVAYIKPNIDITLGADKRMECREIVQEIRKFGVGQRQMLYLIQLLALELENREVMIALMEALRENREKVPVSRLITE